MTIQETWSQGIQRLAHVYIDDYKRDSKIFVTTLKNTKVPREILRMLYNNSVADGLTPFEDLQAEEKSELEKEVGESDDIKNICKALYVIKKVI